VAEHDTLINVRAAAGLLKIAEVGSYEKPGSTAAVAVSPFS
jgi:hypothetical protein